MDRVFISHSHKDREFAEGLAKDLSKNGLRVWYSEWEMLPGDSLTKRISEGILASGSMLVLLSGNSVKSKWVEKEFSIALVDSLAQRDVRIFPVLLEDCIFPRSFHFLGDIIYADFREDYHVALRRLLSALGRHPSRRGIKTFAGDPRTLEVSVPPALPVAKLEGLRMLWTYDSRTETAELHLSNGGTETIRPLLEVPATKREARKLENIAEREGWGYYDLAVAHGPYLALVQLTFLTHETEYVTLRWLLDRKRRRILQVLWDRFVDEPIFESYD